jgi:uncharacterized membrane protein
MMMLTPFHSILLLALTALVHALRANTFAAFLSIPAILIGPFFYLFLSFFGASYIATFNAITATKNTFDNIVIIIITISEAANWIL